MITLLSLKDFVLVDALCVDVSAGLTCLTGETGAGKSLLVDGLEFVLGARGDVGCVRPGALRCEAAVEVSEPGPEADSWLSDNGLSSEEGILLLRRTMDLKGRTRCWINATPVTVAQLRELGEKLVDLHGQHSHQSLLRPAQQLQILDSFAGDGALLQRLRQAWREWRDSVELLAQARERSAASQAEAERLGLIDELLGELAPRADEWPELSEEHGRLANAAEIRAAVDETLDELSRGQDSAAALLARAEKRLSAIARHDPHYAEHAAAIAETCAALEERARELSRWLDHSDLDESRFAEVDERLSAYWRVARKLQRQPEELAAYAEEIRGRLARLSELADHEVLRQRERERQQAFRALAEELSGARAQAAEALSREVSARMGELAMAGGSFRVRLNPCEPWSGGLERAEFLVSPHPGAELKPLARAASGGELSRVSLAIAVVAARGMPVATMIFDEVDSGIGGAVAEIVGRLLRRLGETRQVLCVTHLPQVAACAHQHWLVSKETRDGTTLSRLRPLSPEERAAEVARMAGGQVITEATVRSAEEMLAAAEGS